MKSLEDYHQLIEVLASDVKADFTYNHKNFRINLWLSATTGGIVTCQRPDRPLICLSLTDFLANTEGVPDGIQTALKAIASKKQKEQKRWEAIPDPLLLIYNGRKRLPNGAATYISGLSLQIRKDGTIVWKISKVLPSKMMGCYESVEDASERLGIPVVKTARWGIIGMPPKQADLALLSEEAIEKMPPRIKGLLAAIRLKSAAK